MARSRSSRSTPILPFDEAAVFGCAVMTGVGAVTNTVQPRRGSRVRSIGLGGVGLAALLGARTSIEAVDRDRLRSKR